MDGEELEKLYWKEKLSTLKIAEKLVLAILQF